MGIDKNSLKFLSYAKKVGASFEKSLTLGRQNLFITPEELSGIIVNYNLDRTKVNDQDLRDKYAEVVFKLLGGAAESMDFSDYEGADIVHDLNNSIPDHLKSKYTAVFDGGTLEHVFNFPQAIKNCMQMLKIGGHYLAVTPANGFTGHGFYQFSPELFFRIFTEDNGFEIVKVIYSSGNFKTGKKAWYEVSDPEMVKNRVTVVGFYPSYLLIIAKKTSEAEIFFKTPQQSDYSETWHISKEEADKEKTKSAKDISLKTAIYRGLVPKKIRDKIWRYRFKRVHERGSYDGDLGYHNPDYFKKMDFNAK